MNQDRIDLFFEVYEKCLVERITLHPDNYGLLPNESIAAYAGKVTDKFKSGLLTGKTSIGGINTTTPAWRKTCRMLQIGPSRQAIEAFLAGE